MQLSEGFPCHQMRQYLMQLNVRRLSLPSMRQLLMQLSDGHHCHQVRLHCHQVRPFLKHSLPSNEADLDAVKVRPSLPSSETVLDAVEIWLSLPSSETFLHAVE